MNTTATSEPTPVAEVPLTRAAKEALLRQMYSLAHWIALIRLIGYQSVPMDKARQAIKPLAEQYGKEPVANACEVLVEIFTPGQGSVRSSQAAHPPHGISDPWAGAVARHRHADRRLRGIGFRSTNGSGATATG